MKWNVELLNVLHTNSFGILYLFAALLKLTASIIELLICSLDSMVSCACATTTTSPMFLKIVWKWLAHALKYNPIAKKNVPVVIWSVKYVHPKVIWKQNRQIQPINSSWFNGVLNICSENICGFVLSWINIMIFLIRQFT